MAKVLLLGENNPYGDDPHFALYPSPVGCTGWRLCHKVLELPADTYLEKFERRNLLQRPKWSAPLARLAARTLLAELGEGARVVVLGARVATALDLPSTPFETYDLDACLLPARMNLPMIPRGVRIAVLPHPSGLCRVWGSPNSYERARRSVFALERVS